MRNFLVLLPFLLIYPCFAHVVINEVVPNPSTNAYNEWIEIYNQKNLTLNLSNWYINDSSNTYNITCAIENCSLVTNSTYFIIIWKKANISQITNESIIYFNSFSGKNYWLANSGETIILYNSTYSTNFTYNFSRKGKSWARYPDGGNWTLCNPTPGKENNCTVKPFQEYMELGVYLKDTILLNITYNKLFKIEARNKENCSIKDNVTISYNIKDSTGRLIKQANFTKDVGCSTYAKTGNWTPTEKGNFTICGRIINASTSFDNTTKCKNITVINSKEISCDLILTISAPLIWNTSKTTKYYIFVNDNLKNYSDEVEIIYWIEDFFDHYIKKPYTTTKEVSNNFSREFTPKLDCGTGVYLIKANISNSFCNDINLSNNFAEKLIVVIGDKECEPEIVERVVYKTAEESKTTIQNETKELEIEILNLTKEVARNEEFITIVKLKNNLNKEISVELYSYAFKGRDCITGGWTSYKKEISLDKKEQKTVKLTNKIEEKAKPGEYSFRVRAKVDNEIIDKTEKIIVTDEIIEEPIPIKEIETPKLEIWNDTKIRIKLSNCENCKMIITGPNLSIVTSKKYRVFDKYGEYKIFVIKNNEIVLNKTYLWKKQKIKNLQINNITKKSKITGKIYERNIVENVINTLNWVFNYLVELMNNAIKK